MLARDLGAVPCAIWVSNGRGFAAKLPRGSVVVVEGRDAERTLTTLRAAGPKILQLYATLLDEWQADESVADPERLWERVAWSLAAGGGSHRSSVSPREIERAQRIVGAMARLDFVSAPASRRSADPEPGPPVVIDASGGRAGWIRPGERWIGRMRGPSPQIAKLPRSFLSLHARNDRYGILLSWYLSIMVRVNRKYGFSYHVKLRTLLEGLGIPVPRRNPSRFLAAVLRGLETAPGFVFSGPVGLARSSRDMLVYSSPEILSSIFVFRPDRALFAALAVPALAPGSNGEAERANRVSTAVRFRR
jgi:hypothetical protein